MAMDCNSSGSKKLKMFGFGIPGQGLYAFNFPDSKIKAYQAIGLLTILAGDASEEKVDKELRNLVKENWDFKVKQIHLQEYLVIFPDKGSLETFTKLSEFQMSLYGLKGTIEKTTRDYTTSSMLHIVWIKVHGVPDLTREVDSVKEIVSLVVEPIVVDELSLIKEEPIRVQARCRNPGAIRGSIEIFLMVWVSISALRWRGVTRALSREGKRAPLGLVNLMIKLIRAETNIKRGTSLERAMTNLTGLEKLTKTMSRVVKTLWKRALSSLNNILLPLLILYQ
jgi:hypothetical protein